jgi:hypothetical protein
MRREGASVVMASGVRVVRALGWCAGRGCARGGGVLVRGVG